MKTVQKVLSLVKYSFEAVDYNLCLLEIPSCNALMYFDFGTRELVKPCIEYIYRIGIYSITVSSKCIV